MTREEVLQEARGLVVVGDELIDYACDCEPGGERFLVKHAGLALKSCYNLDEFREKERAE